MAPALLEPELADKVHEVSNIGINSQVPHACKGTVFFEPAFYALAFIFQPVKPLVEPVYVGEFPLGGKVMGRL